MFEPQQFAELTLLTTGEHCECGAVIDTRDPHIDNEGTVVQSVEGSCPAWTNTDTNLLHCNCVTEKFETCH